MKYYFFFTQYSFHESTISFKSILSMLTAHYVNMIPIKSICIGLTLKFVQIPLKYTNNKRSFKIHIHTIIDHIIQIFCSYKNSGFKERRWHSSFHFYRKVLKLYCSTYCPSNIYTLSDEVIAAVFAINSSADPIPGG